MLCSCRRSLRSEASRVANFHRLPSKSTYSVVGAINQLHVSGDAQVNTPLFKYDAGATKQRTQLGKTPLIQCDNESSRFVPHLFSGLRGKCSFVFSWGKRVVTDGLQKTVPEPAPGLLAMHFAVGDFRIPPSRNQERTFQHRSPL